MKNFFIGWCLGCFITLNAKILLSHNKRKAFLIKIVSTSSYAVKFSSLFRMLQQGESFRIFHRQRTESDRVANGIRSGGGRNPIGRRTESDRAADGIRLGGERNPIGRRTESDRAADANGGKMLGIMRQKARSDGLTVGGYGNKKGATPLRELRLYAYRLKLSASGSRRRANECVD